MMGEMDEHDNIQGQSQTQPLPTILIKVSEFIRISRTSTDFSTAWP